MAFKRVLILVEGQTEEGFVKNILNPLLKPEDLLLIPTLIRTKLVKSGGHYKGGVLSYGQVKRDLQNLFRDTDAVAVTTMFDFYALPTDFPKWTNTGSCYEKVAAAEKAFEDEVANARFIPYLQLHEFEGLLFSSPRAVSEVMREPSKLVALERIRAEFGSPEEINHGPLTHPSKRLLDMFPSYQKILYGSLIAREIGLDGMRTECPHFNSWVGKLTAL